jgi:hypothetical protein
MKNLIFTIVFMSILQACTERQEKNSIDFYSNIKKLVSTKKRTSAHIRIDTIWVENKSTISGDGFWKMKNDTLYYFDRLLGTVNVFSEKGNYLWAGLGLGRSPGEVLEEIGTACPFNNGWFITEVYNVYQFNSQFNNKKMKFLIDFGEDFASRKKELYANPDPTKDIELYVPAYAFPQMKQMEDNTILMKVSCEYPDFFSKEYYEQSAIMAEYDFNKGTITKLMGRYSPVYKDKIVAPFASHYYTPYKNGQYLLSFSIDHNIYIANENFEPKQSFGIKGDFLNDNYIQKKGMSYSEIQDELNNKAYYTSIYYSKPNDLTFRVYKTGRNNSPEESGEIKNPSRMQIYRGTDLLRDVPVPEKFEIIDYIAPYYYADGNSILGAKRDSLGVYKFKINMN